MEKFTNAVWTAKKDSEKGYCQVRYSTNVHVNNKYRSACEIWLATEGVRKMAGIR